jgi:hypothetical protein
LSHIGHCDWQGAIVQPPVASNLVGRVETGKLFHRLSLLNSVQIRQRKTLVIPTHDNPGSNFRRTPRIATIASLAEMLSTVCDVTSTDHTLCHTYRHANPVSAPSIPLMPFDLLHTHIVFRFLHLSSDIPCILVCPTLPVTQGFSMNEQNPLRKLQPDEDRKQIQRIHQRPVSVLPVKASSACKACKLRRSKVRPILLVTVCA